ncbi:tetratricopeptide repeat protein [Novipirellula artificiosorum]|nr:tetratricopeptide repeat protein [Novipirellula artificiosorum]
MRRVVFLYLGAALVGAVVIGAAAIPARAQDPGTLSASTLRAEALKQLQEGKTELAILAADAIVRQHGDDPRAIRLAADVYLRCGRVPWSVRLFDRYVKADPARMPELWQRGIALCFGGDYTAAAEQFEAHRTVNPNDVENAAWHFLCVAKSKSLAEAQQSVLPAPDDPRIPMAEIQRMLRSGNKDAVESRIEATAAGSSERAQAAFYGNFYLGLYADAAGDSDEAIERMQQAAKDAPRNYMGDIARVYAKRLADPK